MGEETNTKFCLRLLEKDISAAEDAHAVAIKLKCSRTVICRNIRSVPRRAGGSGDMVPHTL